LRGVEQRGDRFLAIGVVARDVEKLAGRVRHAVSLSVTPGSSVQHLKKHRMYSRRLSPGCCLQLRSSRCLLGRM
jgi:hypothetical protein